MNDSRPPSVPEWLPGLIERSRAVDGQPPFSDQSLVDLRTGERELLALGDYAAAIVSPTEAELVVDPDARGRGHGTALVEAVLEQPLTELLVWAHGDNAAARALAARFGFEPVRRLLQLRRTGGSSSRSSASIETSVAHGGVSIRPQAAYSTREIRGFQVGVDEDAWVALNAKAFAFHPEQGSVTRTDLEQLEAEPWFDADDFLVLWEHESMIGYCWLKIDPSTASTSSGQAGSGTEVGEIYVIGIDPAHQGEGLGRTLLETGLDRLDQRGVRTAALYVEADNTPALKLYESIGFAEHSVDIQYRLTRFTSRS